MTSDLLSKGDLVNLRATRLPALKDKEEQVAAQKVHLQSLEARLAALEGAIRSTAAAPRPPGRGGRP